MLPKSVVSFPVDNRLLVELDEKSDFKLSKVFELGAELVLQGKSGLFPVSDNSVVISDKPVESRDVFNMMKKAREHVSKQGNDYDAREKAIGEAVIFLTRNGFSKADAVKVVR